MFSDNQQQNIEISIAKSADITNKPYLHSVVKVCGSYTELNTNDLDITFNVFCRDCEGNRLERFDLEIEVFKSNEELVLVIAKLHYPNEPILWSGNKNLWMDSNNGKRCEPPKYNFRLENLATRIKSFIN